MLFHYTIAKHYYSLAPVIAIVIALQKETTILSLAIHFHFRIDNPATRVVATTAAAFVRVICYELTAAPASAAVVVSSWMRLRMDPLL